jgi:hypothetical protein
MGRQVFSRRSPMRSQLTAGISATRILSQKVIFEQEIDSTSYHLFFFLGLALAGLFSYGAQNRAMSLAIASP